MSDWPPTTESPYGPEMAPYKPGNFFTMRSEDHPAYDLFRALTAQGWEWERPEDTRHWLTLTNGDCYVEYSLFGQGRFGCRNEHGEYGIGLEDFGNVWSDALPHIAAFMRVFSDEHAEMMRMVAE